MKTTINEHIDTIKAETHQQQEISPQNLQIERGETQRNVNQTILNNLVKKFHKEQAISVLDLPCGDLLFLGYLKKLFPNASILGADIMTPKPKMDIDFVQMDLTKEFEISREEQFDLITSISGVMMFGNTHGFIENCASRLKPNGTLVITNDNSMTMMDRIRYMVLGRVRMFNPIYEDNESMTQNIPVMELIRLMRIHGIRIEKIEYTSLYRRDLLYLPLALIIYPLQYLYLNGIRAGLPRYIIKQAYPFKHLFCRHYVITGQKPKR